MEVALLVISVLLIIIVLLQSGKAEAAGQIIQGGNSDKMRHEHLTSTIWFIEISVRILFSLVYSE